MIRALSFHAEYACRDTGACCTASWPIDIEMAAAERLRAAIDSGVVRVPEAAARAWVPTDPDAVLLPIVDGRCAFYAADQTRHCTIQHGLGHEALPLACRQFPRVVVLEPGGVAVVLSHFCPTAAGLLLRPGASGVVFDAPAFPEDAEYVGLDARDSLPPLLRPDMAMSWPAWRDIEARAVAAIVDAASVTHGLARVHAAIAALTTWSPHDGELATAIDAAFARDVRADLPLGIDIAARYDEVLAAVPAAYRSPSFREDVIANPGPPTTADVLKRFVAAHAFASWAAYLGTGLRTWVRAIDAAYSVVTTTGSVRHADLLLRHLADTTALLRAWGTAEEPTSAGFRFPSGDRSTRS